MTEKIDLRKLVRYMLKRIWLPILCAVIGFGGLYYYSMRSMVDTFTAYATMYVNNANPNMINFQYTSTSDLNTAAMLVDTYAVVIRSNRVLDVVSERLGGNLPNQYISSTLSMMSVGETGVMRVACTTTDPQLSMDICNAVADIAPNAIIQVTGAGNVEVIDYAELPMMPNGRSTMKQGILGGLAGGVLACGLLLLLFLLNRKVNDSKDITDNYTLPILGTLPKQPKQELRQSYLIDEKKSTQLLASYGKLRMNLFFAIHGQLKTVVVSSAVPGESKSTTAANLAISFAMDHKRVLLIDCDMRKPMQSTLFGLDKGQGGLSDALISEDGADALIRHDVRPCLDVLTAGTVPPNPSELLNTPQMRSLLTRMEAEYDLIVLDTPPINVVPDSLVLSDMNVGMLYVARCGYSDHREIRKALVSAEYTNIKMLGIVLTCTNNHSDGYYTGHYYKRYYGNYYKRSDELKPKQ